MAGSGGLVELLAVFAHPLVSALLERHVGLEGGVEAALVARIVVAVVWTAASHSVLDALPVLLGLGEVVEQEFGAVLRVAVAEVWEVDDVAVLDPFHVGGTPAHGEEAQGDDLVPQLEHVDAAVEVEDGGAQDLLGHLLRQWLGALGRPVLPALFLAQAVEKVDDAGVLLAVVAVDVRAPVGGEDVVEVLFALEHVGLVAALPARREEDLHVLVGDELVGRDRVAHGRCPGPADVVGGLELSGVVEVPTLRSLASRLLPDSAFNVF